MQNCWELKKCGLEYGGKRADIFGVCPACKQNAGDACWLIAGTYFGGHLQGEHSAKLNACLQCDVYKNCTPTHRVKMWEKFKNQIVS